MLRAQCPELVAECQRFLENRENGIRIVIGCNAIDGQRFALDAFMDQHQLASRFTLILVPALFHGQPDGLHRRFARGQAIARNVQVKVTGPQAVGAVIAVVDTGAKMRAGNDGMAVRAPKISEGGGIVFHSSSLRCI